MKQIAIALTALFLSSPAMAKCETIDYVKMQTEGLKNGLRFTPIDQDKTAAFIRRFQIMNDTFALMKGTRVGVMHRAEGATIVILTFNELGCADQLWPVPAKYFIAIIEDKGI
jgi:hypothetical protein